MGGYIANFTVYTMAMIGLIFFAVFVYKKFTDGTMRSGENKFLSVEDSMSLSPRKTLHIVRAGSEKFLIASDVDRTTLISKLGGKVSNTQESIMPIFEQVQRQDVQPKYEPLPTFEDESGLDIGSGAEFKKEPSVVHLEPIKPKAQSPHQMARPRMDRRAGQSVQKTVTLDFDTPKKHGFSTMKEMAMKINEL